MPAPSSFALFVCAVSSSAQDKKPAPKIDKAQQAEIAAAVKIVDDVMAGQAAPTDFKFTWLNHSMKSRDGKAYVPFLLMFDKGQTLPSALTYYVRVVNKATIAEQQKAKAAYKAALDKAEAAAQLDPENAELAEAADKTARRRRRRSSTRSRTLKTFTLSGQAARVPASVQRGRAATTTSTSCSRNRRPTSRTRRPSRRPA